MFSRRFIYVFDFAATLFASVLAGCDSSGVLPGIFAGGGGPAEVINATIFRFLF